MSASEVKTLKVAWLRLNPRNVKEHPEHQIEQIAASITKFGFADPVGVYRLNGAAGEGSYEVVEGHGRYLAAQKLGLAELPCIELEFANLKTARAYGIAHNQTQQNSGLDSSKVGEEFARLGVTDTEFVALGFTADDMLFLTPDIVPDVEGGNPTGNDRSWADFVPQVHQTSIPFSDEHQQVVWQRLLDHLRSRYPAGTTIAERLIRFAREFHPDA